MYGYSATVLVRYGIEVLIQLFTLRNGKIICFLNCYIFDSLTGLAICSYALLTFINFRFLVMLLILLNFVRYYGIFNSASFPYL